MAPASFGYRLTSIKQIMSNSDRLFTTVFTIFLLAILSYPMFAIGHVAWHTYSQDRLYETSAVRTVGEITGYTYREGKRVKGVLHQGGYFAEVTFQTPKGAVTVTTEARYDTPEDRKAMLGWDVDVLYLPDETQRARVMQFWRSSWPDIFVMFLLLMGTAFGILHLTFRSSRSR